MNATLVDELEHCLLSMSQLSDQSLHANNNNNNCIVQIQKWRESANFSKS